MIYNLSWSFIPSYFWLETFFYNFLVRVETNNQRSSEKILVQFCAFLVLGFSCSLRGGRVHGAIFGWRWGLGALGQSLVGFQSTTSLHDFGLPCLHQLGDEMHHRPAGARLRQGRYYRVAEMRQAGKPPQAPGNLGELGQPYLSGNCVHLAN